MNTFNKLSFAFAVNTVCLFASPVLADNTAHIDFYKVTRSITQQSSQTIDTHTYSYTVEFDSGYGARRIIDFIDGGGNPQTIANWMISQSGPWVNPDNGLQSYGHGAQSNNGLLMGDYYLLRIVIFGSGYSHVTVFTASKQASAQ